MTGLHVESLGELPLGVRRQVAVKIVARNVAAEVSAEEQLKRKKARRLLALKDAQLEGAISDLKMDHRIAIREAYTTPEGERVKAIYHTADFTYKVQMPMDHWPNCCDINDLKWWHCYADARGTGYMVAETVSLTPESWASNLDETRYLYREV